MADDLNEAARAASRQGDHRLAERLFERSCEEHRNPHSCANAVYERFLQGRATAQEVVDAVNRHNIDSTGHGRWLLAQVAP